MDHEHRALEDALRSALTRDGTHPEPDLPTLAAFRTILHVDLPTRRRDDWTPVAVRRRGGRSLRAVLAGLVASLTLGGVALASGNLPGRLTDGPAPGHDPTTSAPPHPESTPAPHPSPPVRPGAGATDPDPDREEPERTATGKTNGKGKGRGRGENQGQAENPGQGQGQGQAQGRGRGQGQGQGQGRGVGRDAEREAKNGWRKNGKAEPPAGKPRTAPGPAGSAAR
ncbi:hypothetical protein ACIRTB_10825 [Streptomyces sp. NPDC101158]|uniref:hypothetical protein n=1 Tax=Streptomyces sp. NPDC101158 TaxID=3366117 RepID=UPI0038252AD1